MMTTQTTWNGTPDEAALLTSILTRYCACTSGPFGVRITTCPGHDMLLHNQRELDGLLVYRHMAERLNAEEQSDVSL